MLPRLPMDSFNFETWRACQIWTRLGIACRKQDILDHRDVLRRHAIGYIPSEEIVVRPKSGETAVMFLVDGVMGWTHLRNDEFEAVFNAG